VMGPAARLPQRVRACGRPRAERMTAGRATRQRPHRGAGSRNRETGATDLRRRSEVQTWNGNRNLGKLKGRITSIVTTALLSPVCREPRIGYA